MPGTAVTARDRRRGCTNRDKLFLGFALPVDISVGGMPPEREDQLVDQRVVLVGSPSAVGKPICDEAAVTFLDLGRAVLAEIVLCSIKHYSRLAATFAAT